MRASAHRDPARPDLASNDLLVVADRLWDGSGAATRRDVALMIRAGRVERVASATECAGWPGARLHVAGATVMPGLMDLHVHLVSVVDPDEPNAIWAEVAW
jgi:imidazolonepropionase-like amidohydrolase